MIQVLLIHNIASIQLCLGDSLRTPFLKYHYVSN